MGAVGVGSHKGGGGGSQMSDIKRPSESRRSQLLKKLGEQRPTACKKRSLSHMFKNSVGRTG